MTNNDFLRQIRYTFDFDDNQMIELFDLAGFEVTREQISVWLKRDGDPDAMLCEDLPLAVFLNGLIIHRRGARDDGPPPEPEEELTNNIIFRKLKIALDLQSEEIIAMLSKLGTTLSKHELSAFFRKPGHKHYRECKDQVLRKFMQAVQARYRPEPES